MSVDTACDSIRVKYHYEMQFDSKLWLDSTLMEEVKAKAIALMRAAEEALGSIEGVELITGCDVEFIKDGIVDQARYDMTIGGGGEPDRQATG